LDRGCVLEAFFDEVRQFEILEEHVEELFLRQRELERVLAAAVGAALAPTLAIAAGRARDLVAAHIFLVARDDVVDLPGAAVVVEDRLGDAARRDRALLAMLDVGDLALAHRLLHRRFDLDAGAREKPLAVAEALAFGIRAAIDNVHRTGSGRVGLSY